MTFSEIFMALFLVCVLALGWWANRRWTAAERASWENFAAREHLEFSDTRFPVATEGLLDAMPFFVKCRYCIWGTRYGEEVFVIQARRGFYYGRGSGGNWTTFVGCKQRFPIRYQPKSSILRRVGYGGGWTVVSTNWFVAVKLKPHQVRVVWNGLRTTSDEDALRFASHIDDNVVLRPRHSRPTDL